MITARSSLPKDITSAALPEGTLFFDIETTGFSPDSSHLYMIGCSFIQDGVWQIIQWFDETKTDAGERLLLEAFARTASRSDYCISFNGATFDFPYIRKKASRHHMDDPLAHVEHLDLYSRLRHYKKFFGMTSMKQKSVEDFLGLDRKDTYSGGELIQVYTDYIQTKNRQAFDALMLHNYEDVKGMFGLLPMLSYLNLFDGNYTFGQPLRSGADLCLTLYLPSPVPVAVTAGRTIASLQLDKDTAILTVHGFDGQLKYFYENYKDYEYLPLEDEAIHKSVAAFVDKKFRQKATRHNCYTKKTDFFLPESDPVITPVFKQDSTSRELWFCANRLEESPGLISDYVRSLVNVFAK